MAAVGRLKAGAESELFQRYAKRINAAGRGVAIGPVEVIEIIEARHQASEVRRNDEADRLLARVAGVSLIVAMDEAGRTMTSAGFAAWLGGQRDDGADSVAFLIGGPDGHGEAALAAARLTLALGPMTLPHAFARIVLAEQVYRATTILSGHPYHRA